MSSQQIPESFGIVAELASNLGVTKVNRLPGLWKHDVDGEWAVEVNGNANEVEGVPPYSIKIRNKKYFVFGVVNAKGGMIVGGQEAEDAFIAAVRAAIKKMQPVKEPKA